VEALGKTSETEISEQHDTNEKESTHIHSQ